MPLSKHIERIGRLGDTRPTPGQKRTPCAHELDFRNYLTNSDRGCSKCDAPLVQVLRERLPKVGLSLDERQRLENCWNLGRRSVVRTDRVAPFLAECEAIVVRAQRDAFMEPLNRGVLVTARRFSQATGRDARRWGKTLRQALEGFPGTASLVAVYEAGAPFSLAEWERWRAQTLTLVLAAESFAELRDQAAQAGSPPKKARAHFFRSLGLAFQGHEIAPTGNLAKQITEILYEAAFRQQPPEDPAREIMRALPPERKQKTRSRA